MSLAALQLPPPRYSAVEPDSPPASPPLLAARPPTSSSTALTASSTPFVPPPYGHRAGFLPRHVADFGTGGSFPEIHIPQFPLGLGKKDSEAAAGGSGLSLILHNSSTTSVPVQYDADGQFKYDAIVQQGRPAGTRVQTSYADMMPAASVRLEDLARPSAEEEAKVVEETRRALAAVAEKKHLSSSVTHVAKQSKEPTFIRYTPSASSHLHASGASQRLIRLTDAPIDPLQPLMFRHKELPAASTEPPVPILQSPPRKLTAEEAAAWKIPPCISNWKNSKGFTIALDKRQAADGRALQETVLGDGHAKLAESLFVAERVAREEVEERARVRTGVRKREKEEKEDELRRLAEEARRAVHLKTEQSQPPSQTCPAPPAEDEHGRRERDQLRRDRAAEHKQALQRQQQARAGGKIVSLRDDERDISEKIALGQAPPTAAQPFDSRLFNQSEGLSAGFAAEDAYSIYDKPLFQGSSAATLYRPRAVDDGDGADAGRGGGRLRPVEFEREDAADPFGLGNLLSEATAEARQQEEQRARGKPEAAGSSSGGGRRDERKEETKEAGGDRRGGERDEQRQQRRRADDDRGDDRSRERERDRGHQGHRDSGRDRDDDRDPKRRRQ